MFQQVSIRDILVGNTAEPNLRRFSRFFNCLGSWTLKVILVDSNGSLPKIGKIILKLLSLAEVYENTFPKVTTDYANDHVPGVEAFAKLSRSLCDCIWIYK